MTAALPEIPAPPDTVALSVVVPMYNEVDNVQPLVADITDVLRQTGRAYEILLVDDGSTDGTADALRAIAARDPAVRVIRFARNFGQTAAMAAGFEAAAGDVIVTLDGDRQNDPADLPALLARLDEGFDLVSGWRRNRQDNALRRLPSRIANRLIARVTGVRLNDYGCTLKAYRRGIIDPRQLYGEMHRFLPVYAAMRGGRITEMVVRHHPRRAGKAKYGLGRTFRVVVDLLLIQLLFRYASRPSHLFVRGAVGSAVAAGVCTLGGAVAMFWPASRIGGAFAWLAALVLGAAAAAFVTAGLCAELVVRARHDAAGTRPYLIAETLNVASRESSATPKAATPSPSHATAVD